MQPEYQDAGALTGPFEIESFERDKWSAEFGNLPDDLWEVT